jgi:ABC-type lipoprotein release transport system permease subunit
LNTPLVALLGVVCFAIGLVAAAEGRGSEMQILRVVGLSRRQGAALLLVEGTVILAAGLLTGAAFGWGLAYLMAPFVMPAVAGSVEAMMPQAAAMNWARLAGPVYALAMAYAGVLGLCGWWWMASARACGTGDGPFRGR